MYSHSAGRLHSQLNYAKLRDTYAIQNREPIWINKTDAASRNIKDGDLVRAFNDQGEVLVGALVTADIRLGAVCIHEGAWHDFQKVGGIDNNGSVNVLAHDIPTSQLANGCVGSSTLVKIEKYTGEAYPLTAFEPPKNA